MLLIAATVLGDIERWWTRHGDQLTPTAEIGDLYNLLRQATIEAEATWSLLIDRGDETRIFSIRTALAPMALLLIERDGDIIVVDVRIPNQTLTVGTVGERCSAMNPSKPASGLRGPSEPPLVELEQQPRAPLPR